MINIELKCKEYLISAYSRSLINYFAPPLIAAGYINEKTVDDWEKFVFRKMMMLPADIKGASIVNLARIAPPASLNACKIGKKTKTAISKLNGIADGAT